MIIIFFHIIILFVCLLLHSQLDFLLNYLIGIQILLLILIIGLFAIW